MLLLISAALFWPRGGTEARTPLRVVVLDASASVGRLRKQLAGGHRAQARHHWQEAVQRGESLAIVRMDASAERLWGPAPAETLDWDAWEPGVAFGSTRASDGGTDWRGAAGLVRNLFGDRYTGSVIWISDGEVPDPGAQQAATSLARLGVEQRLEPPRPINSLDFALDRVALANRVPAGVAFRSSLDLAWRGVLPLDLEPIQITLVWESAQGEATTVEIPWALQRLSEDPEDPSSWVRRSVKVECPALEAGWYTVRMLADCAGDRTRENNQWMGAMVVGEAPLALAVGDPLRLEPWIAAWKEDHPGRLAWQVVSAKDLARMLPRAQVLWTCGASLPELPGAAIDAFVRRGGSWLCQGQMELLPGWSSVPRLGAFDLGALLPADVSFGDEPPRDIALLVDGSGSMKGEPWSQVQSATERLMESIPSQDGLVLHLFTSDLLDASLQFDGTTERGAESQRERANARKALFKARVPGGSTDILRSLESFLSGRRSKKPCLVVLVSDGRQQGAEFREPGEVRTALLNHNVELAIVATGHNPDSRFLSQLLTGEETLTLATDLEGLGDLLEQAVVGGALQQGAEYPVRSLGDPGGVCADLPLAHSAKVRAYVRSTLRSGARLVWRSDSGDPLLTYRDWGRGLVMLVPTFEGASFLRRDSGALHELLARLAQHALGAQQPGARLSKSALGVELHGDFPAGDPFVLKGRTKRGGWQTLAHTLPPLESGLDPGQTRLVDPRSLPREPLLAVRLERPGADPEPLVWPQAPPREFGTRPGKWPEWTGSEAPDSGLVAPAVHPWALGVLAGALAALAILIALLGGAVRDRGPAH